MEGQLARLPHRACIWKEGDMVFPGMEYLPLYFLVFIFGLVMGSFLNVVVYRVPRGTSVAEGRSRCPACNHTLSWKDLIPVLSYLLLKGRCRFCGERISKTYPLTEAAMGIMALGIVLLKGIFPEALILFALGFILTAIALIDFRTMTIPNGLILWILPLAAGQALLSGDWDLTGRVIGALIVSLPMYLSLYVLEDAFGGGDIKLFAALGLFLGWQKTLLTLFIASISAAAIGLAAARAKGEKTAGKEIPFGPFIAAGAFLSALLGDRLLAWYFSLF